MTWTAATYDEALKTTQCQNLKEEVLELYDSFAKTSNGPESVQGRIDRAATFVLAGIETAEDLEDTLTTTMNVMQTVEGVLGPMTFLPYIGGVLSSHNTRRRRPLSRSPAVSQDADGVEAGSTTCPTSSRHANAVA